LRRANRQVFLTNRAREPFADLSVGGGNFSVSRPLPIVDRLVTKPAKEVAIPSRAVQRNPSLRGFTGWKRFFINLSLYFLWAFNPVLCFFSQ
jgi:hypothetical protein